MKTCKKCGQQIEDKAVVCEHCGCSVKVKKPIFKKWWFWAVIVVLIIAIAAGSSGDGETNTTTNNTQSGGTTDVSQSEKEQISYEVIDLQTMIDDLDSNAMRAEEKYQDKFVEITGKISNIDSDGSYISIDPVGSEFNFTSVMCYIKNNDQKTTIMDKSKGDTITIKGKVKSIGEVMGYSIDIKEIA